MNLGIRVRVGTISRQVGFWSSETTQLFKTGKVIKFQVNRSSLIIQFQVNRSSLVERGNTKGLVLEQLKALGGAGFYYAWTTTKASATCGDAR